jgi:ribonuclease-3
VLGCAVAQELYERYPGVAEGRLTKMRADLVCEASLAAVAERLGLAAEMRTGARTEMSAATLANALEALFGAIFVDAGYPAARAAVVRALGAELERLDPEHISKDPKTELQERLQARRQALPQYRVVSARGAAHRQTFEVECRVGEHTATGTGTSRQKAEQESARAMLSQLE